MNENISIVIIDYKSSERTRKYIDDARKAFQNVKVSFVAVDNSDDSSSHNTLLTALHANHRVDDISGCEVYTNEKDVYVVISGRNQGFAKGNNLGFAVANAVIKPDYVIFSNNDIVYTDSFDINRLIDVFQEHHDVGEAGPRIIGLDKKDQSPCQYQNIYSRWWKLCLLWPINSLLKLNTTDTIYNSESGYVYRLLGAFIVCEAKKFQEIDGFDEHTFLFAEEPILSERFKTKNYKTYYLNDIVLVHEGGYTIKKSDYDYLMRTKERFKSELYYYRNYIHTPKIIIQFTKFIFEIYVVKYKIYKLIKSAAGIKNK